MAAATPTFDPIPTLEVRVPPRSALLRGLRSMTAVSLVFGTLGVAALIGVGRDAPSEAFGSHLTPVFMSFAVGDVQAQVPVLTEPGGGDTVALLAPGTRVGIGGRVAFGGGWANGVAYWVSAEVDGHAVRGFVPTGSVHIQAGNPPVLAMDGDLDMASDPAANRTVSADSIARPDARAVTAASELPSLAAAASEREAAASASLADEPVRAQSASSATDAVSIAWLPAPVQSWSDLLNAAARTHGVAADLLAIVTLVESGGHPAARSHVGATGLMQVMPATAGDIARQRGITSFDASQLNDPAVAIDFGAWYLAQQLKAFGQAEDPDWSKSVTLAAAAYNGGPGTAMRYQRGGGLPSETQHYIDWVGGMWRERADASSPTYERWMAAGGSVLVGKAQAWLDAGGAR